MPSSDFEFDTSQDKSQSSSETGLEASDTILVISDDSSEEAFDESQGLSETGLEPSDTILDVPDESSEDASSSIDKLLAKFYRSVDRHSINLQVFTKLFAEVASHDAMLEDKHYKKIRKTLDVFIRDRLEKAANNESSSNVVSLTEYIVFKPQKATDDSSVIHIMNNMLLIRVMEVLTSSFSDMPVAEFEDHSDSLSLPIDEGELLRALYTLFDKGAYNEHALKRFLEFNETIRKVPEMPILDGMMKDATDLKNLHSHYERLLNLYNANSEHISCCSEDDLKEIMELSLKKMLVESEIGAELICDSGSLRRDVLKNAKASLETFHHEPYVRVETLEFYKSLKEFITIQFPHVSSDLPPLPDLTENTFFTFIKIDDDRTGKWVSLCGADENEIEMHTLTKLVYTGQRHDWDSVVCLELRHVICKIKRDSSFMECDLSTAADILEQEEENKGYRDHEYSDDSDDEHIEYYTRKPRGERYATISHANKMGERGQVDKFFRGDGTLRTTRVSEPKKYLGIIHSYDISFDDRAKIVHEEEMPTEVYQDLATLNDLISSGDLAPSDFDAIGTNFYIAQYRGIHYATNAWSADTRKPHRQGHEAGSAYFSSGTYALVDLDSRIHSIKRSEAQSERLRQRAILNHHQAMTLHHMGKLACKFKSDSAEAFVYDSPADALQDFYTKRYDDFHERQQAIAKAKKASKELDNPLDVALLIGCETGSPTISTGDTPYTGLRYALGLKFYDNQMASRLRPRFNQEAKAARPYSGKVYTFLFEPADYVSLKPSHLISLNSSGRVPGVHELLPERETTFWSYIPEGKLVHEHVARYPSFHRKYSEHFLARYGLNKDMYEQFRDAITDSMPHSPKRRWNKFLLGEFLCGYSEAALIEDARLAAREKGGWLIYRDAHGKYSLVPPRIYPKSQRSAETAMGKAARLLQARINQQKDKRRDLTTYTSESGWLIDICSSYRVVTAPSLEALLERYTERSGLSSATVDLEDADDMLDTDWSNAFHDKPSDVVVDSFNRQCQFIHRVAVTKSISFEIKSPLFDDDVTIEGGESAYYLLTYLGGDCFCGLIERKKAKEAKPCLFYGTKNPEQSRNTHLQSSINKFFAQSRTSGSNKRRKGKERVNEDSRTSKKSRQSAPPRLS